MMRDTALCHKNIDSLVMEVFKEHGKKLPSNPFIVWHLETKFRIIRALFEKYLTDSSKFLDVGCGDGDCLILAQMFAKHEELWGVDIDKTSIEIAHKRCKGARVVHGDMLNLNQWPNEYFDVLHEFGASFLVKDWNILIQQYFRLLKENGILLWELPQKWSSAHLSYLTSVAPRLGERDNVCKRFLRSFLPSKYIFYSDKQVEDWLKNSGYAYEVIETVPLWHFYCRGIVQSVLSSGHAIWGNRFFDRLDRINSIILPRLSGRYLVIRKEKKL